MSLKGAIIALSNALGSNIGGDERVETKFLDGDTELGKLAFVGLDHVGMGFSDFLQFSLDLADGLVLQLLDFLKRAADHAEGLGIDSSGCQNLVSLSVLSLQALLDGLELLLKDEGTETSLAMDVIHNTVELLEECLLLLFDELELLETNFILPFELLVLFLSRHDLLLLLSEHFFDVVVLDLLLKKTHDFLLDVLKRLDDHVVGGVLDILLTVGIGLLHLLLLKVTTKGTNHIHVQPGDVVVVVMDVLVLLLVLRLELLDDAVLLRFNLGYLSAALALHVSSETSHLRLVLLLNLASDALVLLSLLGSKGVVVLVQGVTVLGLTNFLFFLLDLEGAQVLLKLTFVDAVLILGVLQLHLGLLFDHGLLVQVLEH